MNLDHYAVVVGLTSYPGLNADLKGPENDARAIAAWLRHPNKGGLPNENVKLILSSDYVVPGTLDVPTRGQIENAFRELSRIAKDNPNGLFVGTRLYLYVSGHGFSPRRSAGCLFAGNVAADALGANVNASAFIEIFQDAGYFQEFVLWMDCCMDRMPDAQASLPELTLGNPDKPPVATAIAFAARRSLKALEQPIPEDGGNVHGIFTWNLLQGLEGAAANAFGVVTGKSLANWLRNSQLARMPTETLVDRFVAKEPEIVQEDDALIFARGLTRTKYTVKLKFKPADVGLRGRLWSGRPARSKNFGIAQDGVVTLKLEPGLYVVDVPAANLQQGFEVTRNTEVMIETAGPRISTISGLVNLVVDPGESDAEIFLVDEAFGLVDRSKARFAASLPCGIYKLRTRAGRRLVEQVIMLDRDMVLANGNAPQLPVMVSAAPLPGTAQIHEYHEEAAAKAVARAPNVVKGTGAELMLMVRCFTAQSELKTDFKPWHGVTVVNASGDVVVNLDSENSAEHGQYEDRYATCKMQLDPGVWFLRQPRPGGISDAEIEQALVVSPGWRTDAYLLRTPTSGEPNTKETRPSLSVFMRPLSSTQWTWSSDVLVEKAKVALADERLVLTGEIEELLVRKFDNPIAGILGGHLLLVESARGSARRLALLNEVVKNLRGLVGDTHPDVEALSLRCPDSNLRTRRPLSAPPIYEASWRLFVDASQRDDSLIPAWLWERVHAQNMLLPYFTWASDAATKRQHRNALDHILSGNASSPTNDPNLPQFESGGSSEPRFSVSTDSLAPAGMIGLGPTHAVKDTFARKRLAQLGLPPIALS